MMNSTFPHHIFSQDLKRRETADPRLPVYLTTKSIMSNQMFFRASSTRNFCSIFWESSVQTGTARNWRDERGYEVHTCMSILAGSLGPLAVFSQMNIILIRIFMFFYDLSVLIFSLKCMNLENCFNSCGGWNPYLM